MIDTQGIGLHAWLLDNVLPDLAHIVFESVHFNTLDLVNSLLESQMQDFTRNNSYRNLFPLLSFRPTLQENEPRISSHASKVKPTLEKDRPVC